MKKVLHRLSKRTSRVNVTHLTNPSDRTLIVDNPQLSAMARDLNKREEGLYEKTT
jgi:hypothetical protein